MIISLTLVVRADQPQKNWNGQLRSTLGSVFDKEGKEQRRIICRYLYAITSMPLLQDISVAGIFHSVPYALLYSYLFLI